MGPRAQSRVSEHIPESDVEVKISPEFVRPGGTVRWLGKTCLTAVRGGEATADSARTVGKHPLPISPSRIGSPYLLYVKWDVLSALEDRRLIDGLRFLPFIGQRVHCNLAAPVFAHDEHAIWNLDVPASNPQVLQSW